MRSRSKMVIVGTLGALACAAAIVQVQAASMNTPAYVIAYTETVTDTAMLAKYVAAVGKSVSDYGGHAIVRGSKPVKLDESPLPKGSFAVLQFPSMKALQDWWNSPEYAAVRPYREQSTVGHVFALQGVPTP